jgi:uncharacterized protein (UPF0371 family)
MPLKKGFDNERDLADQTDEIFNRVNQFDNKLYLEFGGEIIKKKLCLLILAQTLGNVAEV